MDLIDELCFEAAKLARKALNAEVLCGGVLVWDVGSEEPRELVYELEGWHEEDRVWIANDTTRPGEPFGLEDIADTRDVKCFAYFLTGVRGAIYHGEPAGSDDERFLRFEEVGGLFGKYRLP